MKTILCLLAALSVMPASAQSKDNPTLKSILLEQLRTTHNQKDWFVPVSVATEGVTAEQAKWTDGKGNHSIGQLTNHLLFWNRRSLAQFKGEPPAKMPNSNDETFNNFDPASWDATRRQLDEVLSEWEKGLEAADDAKLKKWASTIAHIGAHNAYHVGQIVYIRKLQGSWDPEKGVK